MISCLDSYWVWQLNLLYGEQTAQLKTRGNSKIRFHNNVCLQKYKQDFSKFNKFISKISSILLQIIYQFSSRYPYIHLLKGYDSTIIFISFNRTYFIALLIIATFGHIVGNGTQ